LIYFYWLDRCNFNALTFACKEELGNVAFEIIEAINELYLSEDEEKKMGYDIALYFACKNNLVPVITELTKKCYDANYFHNIETNRYDYSGYNTRTIIQNKKDTSLIHMCINGLDDVACKRQKSKCDWIYYFK